jgi:CBS domain-containing protein
MKGYELLLRELSKIKRHGIHGLIVTDNKKPQGIITTYDALLVMARGENGKKILVKDVMSPDLISTKPGEDILNALELMLDNQLTKLPVIKDGELVGILSATDFVDAFDKLFLKGKTKDIVECRRVALTVKDVMHKPTIIDPESSVLDAARIMSEKEIGSVLIRKGDTYGILTERDIFTKVVSKGLDTKKIKVSEVMSAPCYTVEAVACVSDASRLFNKHDIRRLPVVENGEIIGVVSARDVAKTIVMKRRL